MTELLDFIESIEHEVRKADAMSLLSIMEKCSGYQAYLNGSIIGFGLYHYKYDSGKEGESCVVGFSPRKQHLVLYIMSGFLEIQYLLAKLGKYKTGSSCLYIKKLADIDLDVLQQVIKVSVSEMQEKYTCR